MVLNETVDGDGSPLVKLRADNQAKVNVFISDEGVRFIVEEGKYVQAGVDIRKEMFKTFSTRTDSTGFKIHFKGLLDCMKILGADGKIGAGMDATDGTLSGGGAVSSALRSMEITYNGYGSPMRLSLEEPGMQTEIELKTEELDGLMEFDELESRWEIIMEARLLQEFLVDLESYAPDSVILRVVPNTALDFLASGTGGSLKIRLPKHSTGIEKFCTIDEPHQSSYKFSVLKNAFKLIQTADKVVIRMMDQDVMSFNILYKETVGTHGEFIIMPQAVDDDGEVDLDQ